MVFTDFVDDYVQDYVRLLYVCAEVLLRACPTHSSLSSAKLNPAQHTAEPHTKIPQTKIL